MITHLVVWPIYLTTRVWQLVSRRPGSRLMVKAMIWPNYLLNCIRHFVSRDEEFVPAGGRDRDTFAVGQGPHRSMNLMTVRRDSELMKTLKLLKIIDGLRWLDRIVALPFVQQTSRMAVIPMLILLAVQLTTVLVGGEVGHTKLSVPPISFALNIPRLFEVPCILMLCAVITIVIQGASTFRPYPTADEDEPERQARTAPEQEPKVGRVLNLIGPGQEPVVG
ncbi:MAG: hypothetical protein ABIJ46_04815 [bacterium]